MGLLHNLKAIFHDDWCSRCRTPMHEYYRQLYMLPVTVDHYVSHKDADYFIQNLIKVKRKADIPPGTYACGAIVYRCPACGHRLVKLSVFLPVRDQEKFEDYIYFEQGEMDDFLYAGRNG